MISVWGYEAVLSDDFHNRDPARLASQVLSSLLVLVAFTHNVGPHQVVSGISFIGAGASTIRDTFLNLGPRGVNAMFAI
jgi:uncharacterized membrane protein YhiD involved in acid resistance